MATGDTLLIFTAPGNEPPASNYATLDSRNLHPLLDFDDSSDESAVFTAVMPRHYDGGGLTAHVVGSWTSDTNNAHTTQIDISLERIGDGQLDIDGDSFAAAQSATLTVPATSGLTDQASAAFSDGAQMDNIASGELFRLKVTCNTAAGDHSGDFELHSIELVET